MERAILHGFCGLYKKEGLFYSNQFIFPVSNPDFYCMFNSRLPVGIRENAVEVVMAVFFLVFFQSLA